MTGRLDYKKPLRRLRALGKRAKWAVRALLPPPRYIPRMGLVSPDPVILHCRNVTLKRGAPAHSLLHVLRRRKVDLAVTLTWNHEKDAMADGLVKALREIDRHKNRDVVILANTPTEQERFRVRGARSIHFSGLAMADESVYRPLPDRHHRFDAIYDARLMPYKRHLLTSEIDNLALLTGDYPELRKPGYEAELASVLARAHLYNGTPGSSGARHLSPEEVNESLNECAVGLCLSAEEGAMRVSIQYLLAGLPVVSTLSIGGRDEFFDSDYVKLVDPTPKAVANGVAEMVGRKLDPHEIRARTLEKMQPYRDRFFDYIDAICEAQGKPHPARLPWPERFGNRLFVAAPLDVAAALRAIRGGDRP